MAAAEPALLTFSEARARNSGIGGSEALAVLVGWVEGYLMNANVALGRTGAVCPFTRQAARINTARLAICEVGAGDEVAAFHLIRACFRALEKIPAKTGMAHFRTVIVGFPNCADADGVAMLQRVQGRHKFYSLARNRMIGLMHPESDAPGLWNAEFRPLRAPLPVLAIRHMVEQDAPFAVRHPLLLAPYLMRFPLAGAKRLIAHARVGLER